MRSFRSLNVFAFVVSAFVVTAPTSSAQSAEPTSPNVTGTATSSPDDAAQDDVTVEKRRVLRLAGGQTIRVVSRCVDGQWSYKSKSGWKTLEAGAVRSAQLENRLVSEFRAKRGATDLHDVAKRAELAAWGARAGLTVEALAELEAILAQDPDQTLALETLRSNWFFTVPALARADADPAAARAAEDDLMRFGAAQTACGRELAVLELARHTDKTALQSRLANELGSTFPTRRAFASLALRRMFPGAEAKPLMVHAVLDASADVRQSCALALKAANEPALCVPIVRALSSKSPAVRVRAAEALGVMGYAAAVEPLVARMAAAAPSGGDAGRLPHSYIFVGRQVSYVQDFDVEVAQFQAVADPQINVYVEGSVMDTAVSGVLEVSWETESVAIGGALAKLTGEKPTRSAKAWLAWWEKNKDAWRSEDRSRPKTGTPG